MTTSKSKNSESYYKDEPFTTKRLHQRLIITYSPKYAAYQKAIRAEQIARAEKMMENGSIKKQLRTPNDPARFVNETAVTEEGEKAKIHYYLDLDKITGEEMYDGLYAVCTDLLDDDVADIHEACGFRTDYEFIIKRKMKEIQKKSKQR